MPTNARLPRSHRPRQTPFSHTLLGIPNEANRRGKPTWQRGRSPTMRPPYRARGTRQGSTLDDDHPPHQRPCQPAAAARCIISSRRGVTDNVTDVPRPSPRAGRAVVVFVALPTDVDSRDEHRCRSESIIHCIAYVVATQFQWKIEWDQYWKKPSFVAQIAKDLAHQENRHIKRRVKEEGNFETAPRSERNRRYGRHYRAF